MPDSHDQFDYLCALEASGQISTDERKRLGEHLKTCAVCRQALDEYNDCAEALAEQSEIHSTAPVPSGMYQRFRARAQNDGIQLPKDSGPQDNNLARVHGTPTPVWFAVAAVVLLILVLTIRRPSVLHNEPQKNTTPATATEPSASELALRDKLRNLQERQNEITVQLQKEEQALRTTEADKQALSSRIVALQKENDDARNRLVQAEADVHGLKHDLENAQAEKTAAKSSTSLEAAEIAELKGRIATVEVELSRERRLSAALDEMRSLMENRDVRVIQLGGVNQGKQVRAFGRAFYVPRRKLVLFAYDLSDPKMLSAYSFYVWGDKPGTSQPAQALGRLTLEDQKDDRWAIRIESPDVFTRINEIFITIESNKGTVAKPTGQPMLLTSLTNPHP